MKYYIDPAGALYAYNADGSQDSVIPANFVLASTEQIDAIQNPKLTTKQIALNNISTLEASITDRRIREAILTQDYSFIKSINDQIAILRGSL